MSWWAPLAIIGGAVLGASIAYFFLAGPKGGRAGEPRAPDTGFLEGSEEATGLAWNLWAFLIVGAVVALIVGLAVGLSLD